MFFNALMERRRRKTSYRSFKIFDIETQEVRQVIRKKFSFIQLYKIALYNNRGLSTLCASNMIAYNVVYRNV